MNVSAWCTKIIQFSFALLFILVPLILTPWNYELFEYNKMVVTYGLTVVILGAWIVKMLNDREVRIAKTPLDIPIALFVTSQLVSTLFSMDPHVSWFGYYSRFNGGMWSVLTYVVLYYALLSNVDVFKARLTKVILTTAAVVALYGVAEHFGIDKHLWVQDVQSRVFSTLGQPNWLAAFLAAILPVSLYFAVFNQPTVKNGRLYATTMQVIKHLFGGLTALLFFIVTLYTRSRSGLLGFAVADVLFWTLLYLSSKEKKPVVVPFIAVHALFAIIVFVNGVYIDQIDRWVTFNGWKNRITHVVTPAPIMEKSPAGTLLESGGTESGTIRKYVWQAALTAWQANTKNMAIGTGTETFAFAFYQYRPQGHNMTSEWDFLYNKAHNEYLNYLATTGVFGLGAYLLLIGSFIYWYIKFLISNFQFSIKISNFKFQIGKESQHDNNLLISAALFSGWLSILVTNFFGFSVVIIQLFFFLFPALAIALTSDRTYRRVTLTAVPQKTTVIRWIVAGATLTMLVLLYRYWQADTFFSTGYRLARANQFAQAETFDTKAITLNPGEPMYHDELATTLGSLTLSAVDTKNATLAASLAKQSLAQSDIAIQTSPKNVNFWKTRTKLYYTFSTFDPQLNQAAIGALQMAQTLSPRDPKIIYNLAILYGRQGNNERAVQLLGQAKMLKSDYRDVYFGLYVFYMEMKQPDAARAELQYYLDHVDPNDKDFQSRLRS